MRSGSVAWFTGLPASGKSFAAGKCRSRLEELGLNSCVIDGDTLRGLWRPRPGYSKVERTDWYASLAGLAAELARQGLIVLVAATANLREHRRFARQIAPRFIEIWITTPLWACEARDTKGLYAAARQNPDLLLPGVSEIYEEPEAPEFRISEASEPEDWKRMIELLRNG